MGRVARGPVALWLLLAAWGCGAASHGTDGDGDSDADADTGCTDGDGDGVGVGPGCGTPDCDDTDPATIDQCGTDCEDHPQRLGCRCVTPGGAAQCYWGPTGTSAHGVCRAGHQRCTDAGWGECEEQTWPSVEACDGLDNDCDDAVDEGVANECGGCGTCHEACAGDGCDAPLAGGDGLTTGPGSVSLPPGPIEQTSILWVTNSGDGTVSRVDTRARREDARYRTSASSAAFPWDLAVDLSGAAVVLNRDEGSVTKVLATDCPDANGDGLVETSTGGADVLAWAPDGWTDECIVWTQEDLDAYSGVAVQVTAGPDGSVHESVWIGAHDVVRELDAGDGASEREFGDFGRIAAVGAGREGVVWLLDESGCPSSLDPRSEDVVRYACAPGVSMGFGLAVDANGRVWVGGVGVARLDPVSEEWMVPLGVAEIRAGGVALDERGDAYTGVGTGYRIDRDTLEATALRGMVGIGWAVDGDGAIWAVDPLTNGAHVLDPQTRDVEEVVPPFDAPTSYSALTGHGLLTVTRPVGRAVQTFTVCRAGEVGMVTRLQYEADIPEGASITFRLRFADREDGLEDARWFELGQAPDDPSPLEMAATLRAEGVDRVQGFVQVESTFRGLVDETVVLRRLGLQYSCDDPR